MRAWVIRAGRNSERFQWAWDNGFSAGGWGAVRTDVSVFASKEELATAVRGFEPDLSANQISQSAGQLWNLSHEIKADDLVIMPNKITRELALGLVTQGYEYLAANEPDYQHVVHVQWHRLITRDAAKQDLLYVLGSLQTVFSPTRNDAVSRLKALMDTGEDPGMNARAYTKQKEVLGAAANSDDEALADIEEIAKDQVEKQISQEFAGHDLAFLIAEVLRADGFTVDMAPKGKDGGIDLRLGRGILGIESPRILAQVKTGKLERPVVQQLMGLINSRHADFGLLVTWDQLTKDARAEAEAQGFRLKVWEKHDIIANVLRNYAKLPEEIQHKLPLKQVWILQTDIS
ncbi:restriction endonuclease [Corynebacterium felinum]|uniref:Restriction system protein n=1 Tax=Corynebacterium felinum TaxID=131318 RepID=A0ABU2B7R2_9CORY|nr:restriction endonuclease [Corynebacterium felinum]MDF5821601.1 restriction endonuclease [Corynebacterium felinum]MDR7354645.1 restriction system protein [Corynebacterium felinum]WJY94010.1 Restriction endonuclease [Corynebacterium felinum]